MNTALQQHIENCLNEKYASQFNFDWIQVSGGSINNTYKITSKRYSFFVKTNTLSTFNNGFEEEVLGLQFLNNYSVSTPEIIDYGVFGISIYLVLGWVESYRETPSFWKYFAQQLVSLHQQNNKLFGLDYSNFMGELTQKNTFFTSFSEFFIENRLKPQVELAFNSNKLQQKHLLQFKRLYKELPSIFPIEKPSAIHGDLWSGNYICSQNEKVILIDPAVNYGHREIDLAMSLLFGGFSNKFYTTYQEISPLEKGFNNRKDIYNLYPLLVHLNLFGNSYLSSVQNIITKF